MNHGSPVAEYAAPDPADAQERAYSVFQILVSEVLKNASKTPINSGITIEVERDGGRVRIPNGRLRLYSIDKLGCRSLD